MNFQDLPQPERETLVSPDDLEIDGDNPNFMDGDVYDVLKKRMKSRGWVGNAIVTDTGGVIADGEHRWRAAQELGLQEVSVKQYELSDSQRRIIRQELNKIEGTHDSDRDKYEYERLFESDQADELSELLAASDENVDELLAELDADTTDFDDDIDDVEFAEFDEDIADDIEYIQCPDCGHEFLE